MSYPFRFVLRAALGASVSFTLGCEKPHSPTANPALQERETAGLTSAANVQAKIDASKLLTSQDLQAVIGEPLKEAVVSNRSEAGFAIAQCYFTLPTPSRSVVVTVTTKGDGPQRQEPRKFWEEKFHEDSEGVGDGRSKGEEEAEHPQPAPKKIENVGEEAYWVESGQMGALYALEGDRFIRLAIGGNEDEATKIKKSTALARSVLKRL